MKKTRKMIEAFLVVGVALTFIFVVAYCLPPFGLHPYPLGQYYIKNTLNQVGAWNVVCAILWDYRGYDTLGETAVLFAAIVGIVMLFRGVTNGRNDGHS